MTNNKLQIIGVFALQGAFAEHKKILEALGVEVVLIRNLSDVKNRKMDAVILPGGESTTMSKLLKKTGLDKWLMDFVKSGAPVFGTCAGMIILAQMSLIDIKVDRNAYGSQLDSFEAEISLESGLQRSPDSKRMWGIFIRAPKIKRIGERVKVLAKHGDMPVLVQEKNVLAGSFHPELTNDDRIHQFFLQIE